MLVLNVLFWLAFTEIVDSVSSRIKDNAYPSVSIRFSTYTLLNIKF